FPEVGVIRDGRVIRYVEEKVAAERPDFYSQVNPRVFVLKLIPGEKFLLLSDLKKYYDAIVIESFGVGNLPFYEDECFAKAIEWWIGCGKTVVVTTQVPHEGSDMSVYETGNAIKKRYGVIEAYDMTIEAVVTKLMWILGGTNDAEKIRKLFYTPVQKDII
ncbi:MAG: L-asparaginase 1, partial [Clostridia bacterium]|nr:L-asparaginase 1 [Clostridia bacterium]